MNQSDYAKKHRARLGLDRGTAGAYRAYARIRQRSGGCGSGGVLGMKVYHRNKPEETF